MTVYGTNIRNTNVFTTNLTFGRGYVYSLQYHMVWCTKYRKQILIGEIETDIRGCLNITAKEMGIEIWEMGIMPDHIHLLVNCKPQLRLSDAIKAFKGNSARWLFIKHPELKKQLWGGHLWGGHLWNPSYFVATVSENSIKQVNEYIKNQKRKE